MAKHRYGLPYPQTHTVWTSTLSEKITARPPLGSPQHRLANGTKDNKVSLTVRGEKLDPLTYPEAREQCK